MKTIEAKREMILGTNANGDGEWAKVILINGKKYTADLVYDPIFGDQFRNIRKNEKASTK